MIEVQKPGFYSTIQDLGRFEHQQYGVPIGGAMDRFSAKIANALVGNPDNAAVLEITMTGPTLKFLQPTKIGLVGANLTATINETPIQNLQTIQIQKNDVLSFGKLMEGFRSYLAVPGGFQTERIMGSRSMYQHITASVRLQKEDILKIDDHIKSRSTLNSKEAIIDHLTQETLEVFPGPEFEALSNLQKAVLFAQDFTVSKLHNRMAYQFVEKIPNDISPIITSPVIPGTAQVTPSGELIILMRDCQTTGGYPRILQLSENAINTLAQKYTGKICRFKLIL